MTDDQLLQRLEDYEDNFIERKSAGVKRQELRQTFSAFANTLSPDTNAVLFIGVADDGTITGVPDPDGLQKLVREVCERECYPPITSVACRVLQRDGKAVVAVMVGASANRPHFTGPAYLRRGSESVVASEHLFHELIASRNDKTARILRMRGRPITVQCLGHKIGDTKPIADAHYRESSECFVEECDAHVVWLSIPSSGRRVSEPLDNVWIGHDVEKWRDMLIVKG